MLGAIGHVTRVFEPKNEMLIVGLNSSSSKTNGTRRITLSNLEVSGHALSALKNYIYDDSDTFFFFLSLLRKSHYGDKYSKTTKARNLKFGQMISLYMNLRPCNFGGATSRAFGHMHPKLVTARFIK